MPNRPLDSSGPNYADLVRFLVRPFLEYPESLSVDCESCRENQRIWIRLAFDEADKGKVYGRGGRNLQAIRSVLETAGSEAGQVISLEVYEETSEGESRGGNNFNRQRRSPNSNGDGADRRNNQRRPRANRPGPTRS